MYAYTSGSVIGLPHSSHSSAESGSSGSRMVVRASTNGTAATIAAYFSGARLATAPISSPPAEPPMAAIRAGSTQPDCASQSVAAMKSVKVFFFCSFLPVSYQCRPSSPPPRMWAITNTMPRSSSESRGMPKPGSMLIS